MVGLVPSLPRLVTDACPAFLDAYFGQRGVGAGEGDRAVFALYAGGDAVEDLEADDFANEDFPEEFAGLESEGLCSHAVRDNVQAKSDSSRERLVV